MIKKDRIKDKILAILNQKGGVMKTTLTLLCAQALASLEYSVLVVDMDAQADLATGVGLKEEDKNIFSVLKGDISIIDAIKRVQNFDIIPGTSQMKLWNSIAKTLKSKESRLKRALKEIEGVYDFILIDNPPALDDATINSLAAATHIIIPTEAKEFSVKRILALKEDIDDTKEYLDNPNLRVAGIIPTKVEKGNFGKPKKTTAQKHIKELEEVAKELDTKVFDMFISYNIEYEEIAETKENVFESSKDSVPKKEIAKSVKMLIEEVA